MNDDGVISLVVRGATGIGRPGEARVALVLQEKLVASGHRVKVTSGDDPKGVDRIMVVDGETFILQVTVAPRATDFWRQASQSSATTQVSQPHAASWLREAIETKSQVPMLQGAPVLLALDVRHAGVVAMGALVQEYLSRYGSPTREFGFASVWIVGPVPQYCARLGDGRP